MWIQPLQSFALLQFTAFLSRHIDTINPQILVLFFDDSTSDYANHIAHTFRERSVNCFTNELILDKPIFINLNALFINFLARGSESNLFILRSKSRYIVAVIDPPILHNDRIVECINTPYDREIEVHSYRRPMDFNSWIPNNMFGHGINEATLMRSWIWPAFLNRIETIQHNNRSISMLFRVWIDSSSVGTTKYVKLLDANDHTTGYLTGHNIGMYKIFADKLSDGRINCRLFTKSGGISKQVRYLDMRLSVVYSSETDPQGYTISLDSIYFNSNKVYTCASTVRYLVLVPRILVTSSSHRLMEVLFKWQLIFGILLFTVFFMTLRYCCQVVCTDLPSFRDFIVDSFFDTFARLLAIPSETLLGNTTSERQLLIVITILGFLFDKIFSGILYEQLMTDDEPQYLYNTLNDICIGGLTIFFPNELSDRIRKIFHP